MNITPNSFSDGGELDSLEKILAKVTSFGKVDALDIGAESTAPMNESISWQEEWERLEGFLPHFAATGMLLSIDTYHPETIFKVADKIKGPLIWNDVSGKFDDDVEKFLKRDPNHRYVFCHNLAPERALSGKHMNYLGDLQGEELIEDLAEYFRPHQNPQIIFDPCLGFSKSYEQNWYILENFPKLQAKLVQKEWLLGFSRKSFLRKKLGIENLTRESKEDLDLYHQKILSDLIPMVAGTIWIRTHRPDLLS